MTAKQRYYLCIDMKTFYASVECAERGLNPFSTNLVVADVTRGKNALCLAISPKLKAQGVKNRCRLSDIPKNIQYEVAPPRMALYIEYAADIYTLYLNYFDPADMHVYSIDETFIDATDYCRVYNIAPKALAKRLIDEIADKLHIPSTAGIGTNLYLAKVALDITAKKCVDHMGYLDEELFKKTLWNHRPITDFWGIASGISARLAKLGIYDMEGIATYPEEILFRKFGKDAELMIDHAHGKETCLMEDIKNYRSKAHSVSFSQILPKDYTYEQARIVMSEMVMNGERELLKRKVITRKVSVYIGYSGFNYEGSGGGQKLPIATALAKYIMPYAMNLFDAYAARDRMIRRLGIAFENVQDEIAEGYDLFTDWDEVQKEKRLAAAEMQIVERFGKNAILHGTNLMEGATQIERNTFIGGHRAGYDDKRGES